MKKFVVLVFLLAMLPVFVFAQGVSTGRMDGTVTDPQGAAVPNAKVDVVNVATGAAFSTVTNVRGEWALPSMHAATYRVTVNQPGFKVAVIEGVEIHAGTPTSVPIKLEIGETTETVVVEGGAEIVQATSATVSSTIVGRQVSELPFATRNAVELMVTQAGTQTPGNPRSSTINGLPKGALNVSIDGMNSQDNMLKSSDGFFSYIMPSIDSLDEVSVSTSAAGVDATSQGGAQIKFVTKSGTNEWHGGAFYQLRNTAFNANYYFNNQNGLPRDIIHLRQYGGHLGGPIIKDRLFFFGNVERYTYPGSAAYNRTVLTDDARNGLFTYKDTSGNIRQVNLYNVVASAAVPAGVRPYPTTPDPILAKTFSDISALAKNGVLRSNGPTANDYNTYQLSYGVSGLDYRYFYTGHIDYNVNSNHHVSVVYNYDNYGGIADFLNNVVPIYPGTGTVLGSNVNAGQRSTRFAGTVSLRSAFSPRLTNEIRGGVNGGTVLFFDAVSPGMFAPWRGYYPSFQNLGGGTVSTVTTTASPQRRNAPVKDFSDTVSWVKGSHQFSFGGNWDKIGVFQQYANSATFPYFTLGIAANDPIATGATNLFTTANFPGATSSQLSAAANLYAMLTGRISSITRSVVLDEKSHKYQSGVMPIDRDHIQEYGLFAQDTWRVAPALTVTLGLRYEKQFAFVNDNGTYTQVGYAGIWGLSGIGNMFKPGTMTGVAPTYTPVSSANAYKIPAVWAPSVGFAWQLPQGKGLLGILLGNHTGAAVLRAGYSIASVREGMNVYTSNYGSNQGLTYAASVDPSNYAADFGPPGSVLFRDPTLPVRSGVPTAPQYPIAPAFTNSLYDFDPNLKMGYVQSWNIGFQRELSKNTVVEIRYNGNHGVHLWRRYSLNETNIFENGFLNEFNIAANNLRIARGGDINNPISNNFGNQGLPGQQNLTILPIALGSVCCTDVTTATYLMLGQAGTLANNIATNLTRMNSLIAKGYPANMFRVNPTVGGGSAYVTTNDGMSYYDAGVVELRRRLAAGVLFQGSYTWAKAIAEGAINSSTVTYQPTTFRNLRLDRIPETADIRHAFKLNGIYELPFGKGRALLNDVHNPFLRKAIEGWQIAGVGRFQSGTPSYFSSLATMNANGSGVVLHNITAKQLQSMIGIYKTTGTDGKGQVWFLPPPTPGAAAGANLVTNTLAAFNIGGYSPKQLDPTKPYIGPAPAGQLGWQGYFYLPWQRHFDASIVKRTSIGERANVEFRAQALDAFNWTNFLPSATIGSSFGQVTSAYRDLSGTVDPGARILEFQLRVNF